MGLQVDSKWGNIEYDEGVLRRSHFDESTGRMVNEMVQDVEPILKDNAESRANTPSTGKYRKTLTKVASIPLVLLEQMRAGTCCTEGKTYNLWSDDVEEKRRALVHVQTYHQHAMAIEGTPFAKKRPVWQ